ncbi:M56 family metallopeptidase [Phenylobacterium sp. J367]|uniref:M56 family metallopeptidase n=1 Tax=Phenylobacterium sp. J367 TaxID=2898435 RepID=UPI0021513693|nr:M56 family metallopeptidase [Phenylobacterium sp. J367]MCR5879802.1 M56 family metallopeptidase [Phenylobacterium sp. J367]
MNSPLAVILGPDPLAGLVTAAVYVNLAGAAAVLAVMALRLPLRRAIGPQAAYGLWGLPPAAGGLALFAFLVQAPETRMAAPAPGPALVAVWAAGALALAALFAGAQARFALALRRGLTGPAVVGLISPRIVMPPDDGAYSAHERELIRAHERQHIARKDTRAVAFLALSRCLFWFNPLFHLAAPMVRLDQELACDAAVVINRPACRAAYARALLKTQLAATPLPIGCYWPARGCIRWKSAWASSRPGAASPVAAARARSQGPWTRSGPEPRAFSAEAEAGSA